MSKAAAEAHQAKHGFLIAPQVIVNDLGIVLPKSRCNKTEAAFGLILEAQKRRGDISDYGFQLITVRIGDDCRYTPDYAVERKGQKIELIEIKGPFIREDAMVKFKAAKELHGNYFDFSMWQRKAGNWSKIS